MVLASTALLRYNKTVINPYLLFTERISSPYEFKYEKENKIMETLFRYRYCSSAACHNSRRNSLCENIWTRKTFRRSWTPAAGILSGGLLLHVCAGSFPGRHLLYLYGLRCCQLFPSPDFLFRYLRLSGNCFFLRKWGHSRIAHFGPLTAVEQQFP